jgi:Glycosyl hydrolase family 67 N-terminus
MQRAHLWQNLFSVGMVPALTMVAEASSAPDRFLTRDGQPEAVIVIGRESEPFYRWVATEVQHYVRELSGAELPIVTANELLPRKPLIVLGGPDSNPLAAAAEQEQLVRFAGLKADGFVLRTIEWEGRPVVVAGGNDDTGTMYAGYELLERLGVVFQLTNDIIPQQKRDLSVPVLDVRMEPVFQHRGMHCWHGIRWYMGLDDFRREIDQLAKLKMNVLQFYWGMGGPWAEFSYGGKVAEISANRESGYVAWPGASGTAESVLVGRGCFPEDGYLGPPEFAGVQTQEEAYQKARAFLREVIRYAHSRKVQVWLTMGELPYVPSNLVPSESRRGHSFYCGVALPPGDPAVLDIWEAGVRSMIEGYPEADRYWVVSGSELLGGTRPVHGIAADDPQVQAFVRDYQHLRPLLPQKSQAATDLGLADLDLADIAAADKLVRRIKARHPAAKLGVELIFRGGQLRALDRALPKDVSLMNMVNFHGETAMSYFDGIQGRDLVVWPRITDDGCELNIQLNTMMYDHDETITGAVRYGLTGVLGQLNKARGAEQSAQYIAEGAWCPDICCQSFYERYLRRLYGPDTLETLLEAFLLLEENEKVLGWRGRRGLFSTWATSTRMGVALREIDYRQDQPKVDAQELDSAIRAAEEERLFWEGRAAHCGRALKLMREARPQVWPGSCAELDYVIFKTQNFITVFDQLGAAQGASAAFDRALIAWNKGETAEMDRQLEHSRTALERANRLVREAAQQMIPYAHIPTERHILWIFNKAIPSHETARAYLAEVIAFLDEGKGRD